MKLWTIQHRKFLDFATSKRLVANWERTPQNWRFAYRWMAAQWRARMRGPLDAAPIWCWHSCNGQIGAPPTVGTAAMLLGDWDYWATSMVVVELDVPSDLALLSSYYRWNQAVDEAFDASEDDICTRNFVDMFDAPLMKHDTDDIQAVIPEICASWVIAMRPLPTDDVDWDQLI